MNDPQSVANRVRELVAESENVRRLGIEVLWTSGDELMVQLRAVHHGRVLTASLDGGWWHEPPEHVAEQLTHELVADVLAPSYAVRDAASPWRAGSFTTPTAS